MQVGSTLGHQCPSHSCVPMFFLLEGSQRWESLLHPLPPIIAEKHNTPWIPLVNSFISFSAFSLITPVTAFLLDINALELGGQFWSELILSRLFPCLLASVTHRGKEAQLLQLFPSFLKPLQCIYSSSCSEPSQAPSSHSPAVSMTQIPLKSQR